MAMLALLAGTVVARAAEDPADVTALTAREVVVAAAASDERAAAIGARGVTPGRDSGPPVPSATRLPTPAASTARSSAAPNADDGGSEPTPAPGARRLERRRTAVR